MATEQAQNNISKIDGDDFTEEQLRAIVEPLQVSIDDDLASEHGCSSIASIIEALGTTARDERLRAPLAEAGAGTYALHVLAAPATNTDHNLKRQSYRLLANLCANQDKGRLVVASKWDVFRNNFQSDVLQSFKDRSIRPVADAACAAMMNFLAGSEEIAELKTDDKFGQWVVASLRAALALPLANEQETEPPLHFWDVMEQVFDRIDLERYKRDAPDMAFVLLDIFEKRRGFPEDEIETWISVLAKAFTSDAAQIRAANDQSRFSQLLRLFYSLQEQYTGASQADPVLVWATPDQELEGLGQVNGPHMETTSKRALLNVITNVASQPPFTKCYAVREDPIHVRVVDWIQWPDSKQQHSNEHMIQCAMIIIGNLSTISHYPHMLEETDMATRLYPVLDKTEDDQTRFLAINLLNHCFLKETNAAKDPALSKALRGLAAALKQSLNWQIAHASMNTARIMITPANWKCMFELLDLKGVQADDDGHSTFLARALKTARGSDNAVLSIGAGRLVAATLRAIYAPKTDAQNPATSEDSGLVSSTLEHESQPDFIPADTDLAEPLGLMVTGADMPDDDGRKKVVQAEGWFVMALLAKSKAGAAQLVDTLKKPEVKAALDQALQSKATADEDDPAGRHSRQRQNVIIMVRTIQGHGIDTSEIGITAGLEDLVASLAVKESAVVAGS